MKSSEILQIYKILAKKSLGQNFLIDDFLLGQITENIDIEGKNIIEVGPGYGALTTHILDSKPRCLHLVELDTDMIDILHERQELGEFITSDIDFKIHHEDVLKYTPEFDDYKVIANIPYYITSPILRHFLYDIQNTPKEMHILMQRDVGEKILGGKKGNKSSVLSLFIQKKCKVTSMLDVPKESFRPIPKVESQVLSFVAHQEYHDVDDHQFMEIIKKGFLAPRKKLLKNLKVAGYNLSLMEEFFGQQGWSLDVRGEDLDIGEWITLVIFIIYQK